jgi:hypothetical protein
MDLKVISIESYIDVISVKEIIKILKSIEQKWWSLEYFRGELLKKLNISFEGNSINTSSQIRNPFFWEAKKEDMFLINTYFDGFVTNAMSILEFLRNLGVVVNKKIECKIKKDFKKEFKKFKEINEYRCKTIHVETVPISPESRIDTTGKIKNAQFSKIKTIKFYLPNKEELSDFVNKNFEELKLFKNSKINICRNILVENLISIINKRIQNKAIF